MTSKNKKMIAILSLIVILMAFLPFLTLKQSEFGGSDDAGSAMIEQIAVEYEPWFTPVLEKWLGKEIPGEIESLLFCLQTAIGVGIIAFYIGRFVERKKWQNNK
ncbi:cobalt transport protein CbiN [Clostridium sp. MD294]|uniref:energy-coupling factor ABC transporter substrate-binding protein n=1 Tax=Clostridium sp. MD294 TaxID=97138 RepID=UPI0002CB77D9|nr:cobalt transport protein CbiN [Clostridium sp. MD294]NDO47628.1 cobalt ABC transporter [Clostridium sp. MD294]USF30054.1 Cobalt transport protein CbiN [Clostridium sp. MD294]